MNKDNPFKELSEMFPKTGEIPDYSPQDNDNYGSNFEFELKEHPMKNEIEYKILEFLKDNESGEYIDLPIDFGTVKFLKQKVSELKDNKLVKTKSYAGTYAINNIRVEGVNKPPKCMITMNGKEYLLNIDNSITNQINIDKRKTEIYKDVGIINKKDVNGNQSSFKDSKNIKNKQNNIPNPKDIKHHPIILFILKHILKFILFLVSITVGVLIDNDIIDVSWLINLFK